MCLIDLKGTIHAFNLNKDRLKKFQEESDKTGGLVYIAGDLFSSATVKQRLYEGEYLKSNLEISVFNPISDNEANDKVGTYANARQVFTGDTEVIWQSDTILAELDREDAGVMAELGIAYGINMMMNYLDEVLDEAHEKETKKEVLDHIVERVFHTIPMKNVVAHFSDIRFDSANKYAVPTVGYNHYVWGMLENMGATILRTPEDAMDYIIAEDNGDAREMKRLINKVPRLNGEPIGNPNSYYLALDLPENEKDLKTKTGKVVYELIKRLEEEGYTKDREIEIKE